MFRLFCVHLNVFRKDTVTVTDRYQYPDDKPGDVDAFAREPFIVRFRAPKTGQFSNNQVSNPGKWKAW